MFKKTYSKIFNKLKTSAFKVFELNGKQMFPYKIFYLFKRWKNLNFIWKFETENFICESKNKIFYKEIKDQVKYVLCRS